jgi:prevent-host-death family protein
MDVAVTELRAHLSEWLARVHRGEEIVVTERGIPVARLIALNSRATIERLTDEGIIARPAQPRRPTVRGRSRPRSRRPVAELVSEQRR